MKIIKEGDHHLFKGDDETARTVSSLLQGLHARGMDAVREYSQKFDEWDPPDFE